MKANQNYFSRRKPDALSPPETSQQNCDKRRYNYLDFKKITLNKMLLKLSYDRGRGGEVLV